MSSGNDSNQFPPGEGGAPPPPVAGDVGDTQLNTGRPAVAAAPGKLMFVLLFAAIFVFIIVRSLFFGPKPEVKETPHGKERVVGANARTESEITIGPGSLPTPPSELMAGQTATPPPPPLPPPPPIVPVLGPGGGIAGVEGAHNEAYAKRVHAPMLLLSGPAKGPNKNGRKSALSGGNDPNSAFADNVADTRAQSAVATKIENLDFTILQGKIIHTILETGIDSQIPGPIRGVVTHDVYAEAGKEILIPKGSRVIGVYNATIRKGQSRVFIIWQRVIRPDGIDIFIESPGMDSLGRAGAEATDIDNKYFEMFSTAVMVSIMDIGIAAVTDAFFGNQQQTQTTSGGGTTTTSSPVSTATQEAVQNIGSLGASILGSVLNQAPELFVDQGTPVNVYVNRDLLFPRDVTGAGGGGFIE